MVGKLRENLDQRKKDMITFCEAFNKSNKPDSFSYNGYKVTNCVAQKEVNIDFEKRSPPAGRMSFSTLGNDNFLILDTASSPPSYKEFLKHIKEKANEFRRMKK